MNRSLAICGFASGLACAALPAHAANWLDAAYIVSAHGSTTPVSEIAIAGPAPWLYLDLTFDFDPTAASGLAITWINADWTHESLGLRINDSPAGNSGAPTDKLWAEATHWDAVKVLGTWKVTASLNYFDCVMTYGVGVCFQGSDAGAPISFSVVTTPVPEPSTLAFALAGLGLVTWRARRTNRGSRVGP